MSFARQGRARIMQANRGLLRLHAARPDGRLLGAEMAIPGAEHIAHLLALAIGQGLTVHDHRSPAAAMRAVRSRAL